MAAARSKYISRTNIALTHSRLAWVLGTTRWRRSPPRACQQQQPQHQHRQHCSSHTSYLVESEQSQPDSQPASQPANPTPVGAAPTASAGDGPGGDAVRVRVRARCTALRCMSHVEEEEKPQCSLPPSNNHGADGPILPIHGVDWSIQGPCIFALPLRALACCKPPCTNRRAQRPRVPDRGVRPGRSREACSGVLVGRGKKRLTTAAFALFTAEMWFSITELSSGECDHKSTRGRRVELARQTAVVPGGGHGISPLTGSEPDVVDR